jgi:hypothetical protein
MSRDPEDGKIKDPKTLHKYLYVGSDPVNNVDPRGKDLLEFAVENNAAIPEAKLIDIYGCVVDAGIAAVDLIFGEINPADTTANIGTGLGATSAVIGCVLITPGLSDLVEEGNAIAVRVKFIGKAAGWGACAADAENFVGLLNNLASGHPNTPTEVRETLEALGGCVGDLLGDLIKSPIEGPQDLGLAP